MRQCYRGHSYGFTVMETKHCRRCAPDTTAGSAYGCYGALTVIWKPGLMYKSLSQCCQLPPAVTALSVFTAFTALSVVIAVTLTHTSLSQRCQLPTADTALISCRLSQQCQLPSLSHYCKHRCHIGVITTDVPALSLSAL